MKTKRKIIIFFILLILLIIIVLRLKSFFWVGCRDTGIYAYVGDMILHGQIPYLDIWEHKTPLIYYFNAVLFGLFGSRFTSISIFEVLWLFVACIFIYKLSNMIFKRNISLWVSLIFAVYISTLEIAQSFGMTETYSVLPAIIAVFCVIKYRKTSKRYLLFISGLMAAAAFLFRQTGAVVALPIVLYLAINCFCEKRKFTRLLLEYLIFTLGVLTPIVAFSIYFFVNGALDDCISQAFTFSFMYSSVVVYRFLMSIQVLIHETFIVVLGRWPFLISFAITGILYKFFDLSREVKNKAPKLNLHEYSLFFMLLSWFLVDLYSVSYSEHYYKHYYVQIIPCLALLSGYALEYLGKQFKSSLRLSILLVALLLFSSPLFHDTYKALSFIKHRKVVLDDNNAVEIDGFRYRCETPHLLRWIMKNSSKNDFIYFWGDEVGLNFFIKRKAPSKYVFLCALQMPDYVKSSDLQRFIADFRKNKPKFVIDTSSNNPWLPPLNLQVLKHKQLSPCWKVLLPEIEFINDNYIYERTIDGWDIYRRR